VYKLPNAQNAVLPSRNNFSGYAGGLLTAVAGLVAGVLAFRSHRMDEKS
jgi:formate dehydrogenase iron-sulfur subunit